MVDQCEVEKNVIGNDVNITRFSDERRLFNDLIPYVGWIDLPVNGCKFT